MKQAYIDRKFKPESAALIRTMNGIIGDYQQQGFVLTVRQLYYQLVARAIIPNTERSYKNTASLLNDGRLAGYIDWDAIEDRTRAFIQRSRWADGAAILEAVADQFHADLWEGQERRVYVLVEKEALTGVLEGLCNEYDVPLLACRGYPSVSVVREFVRTKLMRHDVPSLILHLGDHDPSGIDMTRDLEERINLLGEGIVNAELRRIALNMAQVEELSPPPNPAKITDSRAEGYIARFGHESWELDALEPKYLVKLVRKHITAEIDKEPWQEREDFIARTKDKLLETANNWEV